MTCEVPLAGLGSCVYAVVYRGAHVLELRCIMLKTCLELFFTLHISTSTSVQDTTETHLDAAEYNRVGLIVWNLGTIFPLSSTVC